MVSSLAPTFTATPSASVLPSKKTNQDVPDRVAAQSIKTAIKIPAKNSSAQRAKPAVLVPTKSASASIPAAPKQVGAKIDSHTSDQPITKGARAKGGFVHTLTANDGAKAQVYLSKNGAHAGIVFRNKIFRGRSHLLFFVKPANPKMLHHLYILYCNFFCFRLLKCSALVFCSETIVLISR